MIGETKSGTEELNSGLLGHSLTKGNKNTTVITVHFFFPKISSSLT